MTYVIHSSHELEVADYCIRHSLRMYQRGYITIVVMNVVIGKRRSINVGFVLASIKEKLCRFVGLLLYSARCKNSFVL